jgi:hypothetical protein
LPIEFLAGLQHAGSPNKLAQGVCRASNTLKMVLRRRARTRAKKKI